MPKHVKDIQTAVDWLLQSQKTVVFTGAGMSTESTIPDFRSKSGWWKQIDPRTVATTEALTENYQLFHAFYIARIQALKDVLPHEGYHVLARWGKRGLIDLIGTQNVDGLHRKAGSDAVEELHGSIHMIKCHSCGKKASTAHFIDGHVCEACGGKLRPNVVLFGEMLPQRAWQRTLSAIEKAELVLVIGTSLDVYPANQLPMMTDGRVVAINKEAHAGYTFDLTIEGKAGELLARMDEVMQS
ncbi:NAD-dependent deacylase [Salipaludibacillus agaradhaerens]|uniref:SIR2 family NAD-dependent protein deacylase n=1 Tax=Salipaludibacillus agaradhaerens TaxID=76935 RepID=UPI002150EF74|nr:NAD-dependent deacylase [Salipaludibacillus agaradhaerens]MCR6108432.1 NAD-dependent deacylase [Salipaludibacillus agaradhaerens]MCR6120454.1 NAD-dependent deacylase [Salipaludibacillus agaradhaerens]UJW59459.1 NAD-dependent deacylase [Bacillus sp. A116_S68]